MALRLFSPGRAAQRLSWTRSALDGCSRRSVSSTCIVYKDSVTASTSTGKGEHEEAADVGKKSSAGPSVPSSCPPGTVLSGLSLYKDRADPVALPDAEYPAWLWTIMDSSTSSDSSGAVLESVAGLSKGEARAVQKRNLKAVRAAQRGMERKASAAGAGMKATGKASVGEVEGEVGEMERLHGVAAVAVEGASATSVEAEREAKRAMRKANRESIKARNFVSAR